MDNIGIMCGINAAIEYLQSLHPAADDMPQRIVNRLRYVREKEDGVKPTFHPGIYGHKYDTWHCGHCGRDLIRGVTADYCDKCGYRIKWDSIRCLTGKENK